MSVVEVDAFADGVYEVPSFLHLEAFVAAEKQPIISLAITANAPARRTSLVLRSITGEEKKPSVMLVKALTFLRTINPVGYGPALSAVKA